MDCCRWAPHCDAAGWKTSRSVSNGSAFLEVFREAGATDALRCQALTARIATGQTAQLGPALVRQWLTTREVPECERPYAWGFEHGILTPDLLERRARLALEGRQHRARQTADRPVAGHAGGAAAPVGAAAGQPAAPHRPAAQASRHRPCCRRPCWPAGHAWPAWIRMPRWTGTRSWCALATDLRERQCLRARPWHCRWPGGAMCAPRTSMPGSAPMTWMTARLNGARVRRCGPETGRW